MVILVKQNDLENKKRYDEVKEKLREDLDPSIPITHVGSTVIPNMYGKNIIDILIGAKDHEQFEQIMSALKKEGFVASQKSKDEIYQFFSSIAEETKSGDIHIHLVLSDTERYAEFILLKEYLLNHPQEALDYSNFKKEIIQKGMTDRREYKAVKSEYVVKLLTRAKEWHSRHA